LFPQLTGGIWMTRATLTLQSDALEPNLPVSPQFAANQQG
jgi:hypothetical protein